MRRRTLLAATTAAIATGTLAGCASDENDADETPTENGTDAAGSFPSYELPGFSQWIPTEAQAADTEVFFTHVDWAALDELDTDGAEDDDDEIEDVVEEVPIIGLPLYGATITPLAVFGILFYPFAEDVFQDDDEAVDGFDVDEMTWATETLVFEGTFEESVVEARYTDGFEIAEERGEFTVYEGVYEFTDGMAYAVSPKTLLAPLEPEEDAPYTSRDVIDAGLDRTLDETDRLVDDEDGRWLFETTGDAPMVFGAWETEDLLDAIEVEEEGEQDDDPELDDNPVFATVESVVNTLNFTVVDGEMEDLEARFSALYPSESVPTEEEVREHLIGESGVPHEIGIDGTRVHATATFEEQPTQ